MKRWLLRGVVAGLVLFGLIQLVPYGRRHDNPPVTSEPSWDGARTRELAVHACYDCHSNETEWPWYSNLAPASWLLQRDVDEGRAALNFSEWDREQDKAKDAAETVADDEMPPFRYLPLHPEARLSGPEKQALIGGLIRSIGAEPPDEGDDG